MPTDQRTPARSAAMAAVLGVLVLTFLDTTIVTVALGDIQFTLGAGVIGLQWVVNAYALPFASLMLFAGSLGDRLGRKRLMLIGLAVFVAGSVMCAVAPSVGWLIAGRAVMGMGAAGCEPGTLSVIRQLFPDTAQRARAIGGWAAASGLSLAAGPVVGGVLTAAGGWRSIFVFNVVLGVALLVLAWRAVPESRDPQAGRLDGAGVALGAAALGSLIVAGMVGEQAGYGAPWVVALFVVGALAAVAFVVVERRAVSPIVDGRFLGRPPVVSALAGAFAVYFGIFSIFFFTALYLDLVEGYGGLDFARLFGVMAALIVLGSLASGWWVARGGTRWPMVAGALVGAAGLTLTSRVLDDDPSFAALAIALAVAGLGFGIAVVPVTSAVLAGVPARHSGMAAGATNATRQLGAVVGVTVLGALVSSTMTRTLTDSLSANPLLAQVKDGIVALFQTGGEQAKGLDFAHPNAFLAPIIDSTAAAFRSGIHLALIVSAALMVLSAAMTFFWAGSRDARKTSAAPGR